MNRVLSMIRHRIGLDPASMGEPVVLSIAQRVMERRGCEPDQYVCLLSWSAAAWQELIEELVVGETWFFRENQHIETLVQLALQRRGPLRVLSLPCASGEEAYSAALALFDAGVQDFTVVGIDISERALAKAREATYGHHSFRGGRLDLRERYFEAVPSGWRLRLPIRQRASFLAGNVADVCEPTQLLTYDAIFFRNLCIYLEPEVRSRTFRFLHKRLRPGGHLYVASCEASLPPPGLFVARSRAGCFELQPESAHYDTAGATRWRSGRVQQ